MTTIATAKDKLDSYSYNKTKNRNSWLVMVPWEFGNHGIY